MNEYVTKTEIKTTLLQNQPTDQGEVAALESISFRYPYFFAPRFLGLSVCPASERSDAEVQKALLHFDKPHWLHYLLADPSPAPEKQTFKQENEVIAFVNEQILSVDAITKEKTPTTDDQESPPIEQPIEQTDAEMGLSTEDTTNKQDDILQGEKLSSLLQAQLDEFEKAVSVDAIVPIDTAPFYRVDYFAHQGIRLEALKNDVLSVKTRRFTDWLRHIREMQPNPVDLGTDLASENKVVQLAGKSIENPEVITEAMAQVLERQGKFEKALRLYEKLGFLNPAKTAFFAAKIEQLRKKI